MELLANNQTTFFPFAFCQLLFSLSLSSLTSTSSHQLSWASSAKRRNVIRRPLFNCHRWCVSVFVWQFSITTSTNSTSASVSSEWQCNFVRLLADTGAMLMWLQMQPCFLWMRMCVLNLASPHWCNNSLCLCRQSGTVCVWNKEETKLSNKEQPETESGTVCSKLDKHTGQCCYSQPPAPPPAKLLLKTNEWVKEESVCTKIFPFLCSASPLHCYLSVCVCVCGHLTSQCVPALSVSNWLPYSLLGLDNGGSS